MDKKELMSYLKDAYELEKQLYSLNQIKEAYEDKNEQLQILINDPLHVEEEFDGTANENTFFEYAYTPNTGIIPISNRSQQVKYDNGVIYHIREKWKTPEYETLLKNEEKEEKAMKMKGIMAVLLLIFVAITTFFLFYNIIISLIICLVAYFLYKIFVQDVHLTTSGSARIQYQNDCYERDSKLKVTWYQERIDVLSKDYNEIILNDILQTEKILEKLYANNFIHPKYRNLVAVSQIYEYLDTNRCFELEGPNGAYNLFESELRQNIIILKLDEIIEELDRLNATMSYVAAAINQSNRLLGNISGQLSNISSSLNVVQSNTALTAYNTQCISFNAELMRRYS